MTQTFTAYATRIYIDYKVKDGIYNASPVDLAAARAGGPGRHITSDPFDTHVVEPGQTWTLPDNCIFIRQR